MSAGFEERYWSPINSPGLADGTLTQIIHRIEDVTEFIRLKCAAVRSEVPLSAAGATMETDVFLRAQEVADANAELRASRYLQQSGAGHQ